MKLAGASVLGMVLLSLPAAADHRAGVDDGAALKAELVKLEQQSWTAWQGHDGGFFSGFLADDHVEVEFTGPTDKANVVAGVAGPDCRVESYAIDHFHVQRVSADTALLVYHAQQKTTCGSVVVPSPTWASSLYARRNGRWVNVMYQQSPAAK